MKVNVKVTPKASKNSIEYLEEENLIKVRTTAAPVDGKANEAVIKLIAEYLSIGKSQIKILVGQGSRQKILEIDNISKENLIKRPRLF